MSPRATPTPAIIAGLLLAASLAGQTRSKTLPRGFDTLEGNSQHWPGWDILQSSSGRAPFYLPARSDYSYDASVFPWDATKARTIVELRVRQDTSVLSGRFQAFTAHKKEVALWMSVDGFKPKQPRFFWGADSTHGRNKVNVVKKRQIDFAASSRATQPTRFDTVFKFDSPYAVPAGAKRLTIQYNAYTTDKFSPRMAWRPDAQAVTSPFSSGSLTALGTGCPTDWNVSNYVSWSCGEFTTVIDTGMQGVPVIGWVGLQLPKPIPLAPGCHLYVSPIEFAVRITESTGTRGRALFWWGLLPVLPVGVAFSYQFAVVRDGHPVVGTLGLTRGATYTFGQGWTGPVRFSSVYGYGANLDRGDPDKAQVATFPATIAVIWEVQP